MTEETNKPQEEPKPAIEIVREEKPQAILPPQLASVNTDYFDVKPAEPTVSQKKISPVQMIYAQKEYVIVLTEDGMKHPMTRRDALARAEAIRDSLARENIDKPVEERDKEVWLIRELVRAAQDSARQCGRPYRQATVDNFLFKVDAALAKMKRNKR